MTEDQKENILGPTNKDRITSGIKGLVGAIPMAGPLLAEVIGEIIPNQRWERIESFLLLLNERLDKVELSAHLKNPENIDIFEEGLHQSVRALTKERKEYIASLVASGISLDTKRRLEAKRLLQILSELDDHQILILSSYLSKNANSDEFCEKHSNILIGPINHMGSSQEEIDANTLHQTGREQLVRQGLLRKKFKRTKRGEFPEFDEKTGMMKTAGHQMTPLGRLLLRRIELAKEDEV